MDAEMLRTLQAPLKTRYKDDPASARIVLRAQGELDPTNLAFHVETPRGRITAGLHPAAGGDGSAACAGDMMLEALVACAGVTLRAVATTLGITIRSGRVLAEGDLDMRGTLGVSKEVPVGVADVRLRVELDTDATDEQLQKLLSLTERYCVVDQTLRQPPRIVASIERCAKR